MHCMVLHVHKRRPKRLSFFHKKGNFGGEMGMPVQKSKRKQNSFCFLLVVFFFWGGNGVLVFFSSFDFSGVR